MIWTQVALVFAVAAAFSAEDGSNPGCEIRPDPVAQELIDQLYRVTTDRGKVEYESCLSGLREHFEGKNEDIVRQMYLYCQEMGANRDWYAVVYFPVYVQDLDIEMRAVMNVAAECMPLLETDDARSALFGRALSNAFDYRGLGNRALKEILASENSPPWGLLDFALQMAPRQILPTVTEAYCRGEGERDNTSVESLYDAFTRIEDRAASLTIGDAARESMLDAEERAFIQNLLQDSNWCVRVFVALRVMRQPELYLTEEIAKALREDDNPLVSVRMRRLEERARKAIGGHKHWHTVILGG